jgi:hypothetical protein
LWIANKILHLHKPSKELFQKYSQWMSSIGLIYYLHCCLCLFVESLHSYWFLISTSFVVYFINKILHFWEPSKRTLQKYSASMSSVWSICYTCCWLFLSVESVHLVYYIGSGQWPAYKIKQILSFYQAWEYDW